MFYQNKIKNTIFYKNISFSYSERGEFYSFELTKSDLLQYDKDKLKLISKDLFLCEIKKT